MGGNARQERSVDHWGAVVLAKNVDGLLVANVREELAVSMTLFSVVALLATAVGSKGKARKVSRSSREAGFPGSCKRRWKMHVRYLSVCLFVSREHLLAKRLAFECLGRLSLR